jgi:transposase InsO family protein
MASDQLVDGLQLPSSAVKPTHLYLGCESGKIQRSPFPLGRTRANEVGQLIHSNVCGPMHIQTPGGAKFFVLFTDDHSEYRAVFFLKQKSDVTEAFKEYVSNLRSETGTLVHTLRADNGSEFTATALKTWLSEKAIRLETSAPHSLEQNGVSERANRTIVEAGRCLLHAKHLPMEVWGEAISCANYTLNRVSNTISAVTPYQLWYGTKPNISHLRIFGSVAFIHIPKAERRKLDSKSFKSSW